MRLIKKKLSKPFRHVYTEDDYRWEGKLKESLVNIRRRTNNNKIEFWFFVREKDNVTIYSSLEFNKIFNDFDETVDAAIKWVMEYQ